MHIGRVVSGCLEVAIERPDQTDMAMALPTRENLQQSELVFRAKVAQVGASTMLELPASDTTTVVRVEEVYRSPETLRFLSGKSITVVTRGTGSLVAGQ